MGAGAGKAAAASGSAKHDRRVGSRKQEPPPVRLRRGRPSCSVLPSALHGIQHHPYACAEAALHALPVHPGQRNRLSMRAPCVRRRVRRQGARGPDAGAYLGPGGHRSACPRRAPSSTTKSRGWRGPAGTGRRAPAAPARRLPQAAAARAHRRTLAGAGFRGHCRGCGRCRRVRRI